MSERPSSKSDCASIFSLVDWARAARGPPTTKASALARIAVRTHVAFRTRQVYQKRRPMSFPGARAALLSVCVALAGCVLFTPDDLGPTCHFDGETTHPCGQCMAASCRSQIDDACSHDTSLELNVKYIDQCGRGQACSSLLDSKLEACIKASCASVCNVKSS
jgi:hypothetical protein